MTITVTLDPDVAFAADQLARHHGITFDAAVNALIRIGLQEMDRRSTPFKQRTKPLGLRMDVTNIGEVLDALDDAP